MKKFAPVGALLAVLAGTAVHADDSDGIEYRQHIMKTLDEEMAAIGMILANRAPTDALATHTRILATTAATAKKAFEPKIPGGEAKPEVWANWADFAKRLDALTAATGQLAQVDAAAATGVRADLATACKGCHDQYRVPKK